MDSNLSFLGLSPFLQHNQSTRFAKILELKKNLMLTTKAFQTYIEAGLTLCQSLEQIVSFFNLCGSFSSDPTISSISECLNSFKNSSEVHYDQINSTIINPLLKLIDVDIKNVEDSAKESSSKIQNYFNLLEKNMTIKNPDDSFITSMNQAHLDASISNYKFERSIELVERKHSFEITGTVCIILLLLLFI